MERSTSRFILPYRERSQAILVRATLLLLSILPFRAQAELELSIVPGPPDGNNVVISQLLREENGPTSFRHHAPRTGEPDKRDVLIYDPDPSRSDAEIREVAEGHYFVRDRDLGQTFTSGNKGFRLRSITTRLQPVEFRNESDPTHAKVSVQFFKLTGNPVINDNGTVKGRYPNTNNLHQARWTTYAFKWPRDPNDKNTPHRKPFRYLSDDFIEGVTYTPIHLASGGVVPEGIKINDYLRWDFTGDDQVIFEPNTRYAFLFLFDEPGAPGVNRNITLSNINVVPGGKMDHPMPGEHMIRRCGSSTVLEDVFIADPNDPADVSASRTSASFPPLLKDRLALSPGTLGYPDVDTYRVMYFVIESAVD